MSASNVLRFIRRAALGRAWLAVGFLSGLVLGTPTALAHERTHAEDAPLREAPPRLDSEGDEPSGHARLPGMSAVPGPQPPASRLSAGAWVAHGGVTLMPVGAVVGASLIGDERLWKTSVETGAGMLTGYLPSKLLFLRISPGGRVTEFEVAAFGVGLVMTPPLAALGTWGAGEWAFNGSKHRGDAFLGALAGAAAGTLLGVAMYELLDRVAGDSEQLGALRRWVALGLIGSGATVGYQWAGGGPRERHAR